MIRDHTGGSCGEQARASHGEAALACVRDRGGGVQRCHPAQPVSVTPVEREHPATDSVRRGSFATSGGAVSSPIARAGRRSGPGDRDSTASIGRGPRRSSSSPATASRSSSRRARRGRLGRRVRAGPVALPPLDGRAGAPLAQPGARPLAREDRRRVRDMRPSSTCRSAGRSRWDLWLIPAARPGADPARQPSRRRGLSPSFVPSFHVQQ